MSDAAPGPAFGGPEAMPYSALAAGYDAVMAHVDYPAWADYVQALIERHRPGARSVVELGCGTGALAAALQPLGPDDGYAYRAFDGAEPMLRVACDRARELNLPISFAQNDFLDHVPGPPVDVVVLVYDGLNYLLELDEVGVLLGHVRGALAEGGVAILDQSTPANSVNHADGFDDAGDAGPFRYVRASRYDAAARLHTTTFTLTDPKTARRTVETHVQRAYTLAEVRALFAPAGLAEIAAYDGFSLDPATEAAERVHWVLRASDRPPEP